MNLKLKKIVTEVIKELMAGGSSVDGAPSFRGGPYGFGHKSQMANTLDPSVKRIEDLEQSELNHNIEDQQWNLNKFPGVQGAPMQDIHGNPKHEKDMQAAKDYDPFLDERNDADMYYTHLPGFPGMNALESPVQHLPKENLPVDTLRAGGQDGTEDYIIDDIVDELDREGKPGYVTETQQGFPNQQKSALPSFYEDPNEPEEHSLGHMSDLKADSSPPGGYGAIMFPRKFVPDDRPQTSSLVDVDMDGIADNIDLDQPPKLQQKTNEVKTKTLNSDTIKTLVREELLKQLKEENND